LVRHSVGHSIGRLIGPDRGDWGSGGFGRLLIETFDVLLGALEALVKLLGLTVEVRYLSVQSSNRPQEPKSKN
jgi:hypothetical protein